MVLLKRLIRCSQRDSPRHTDPSGAEKIDACLSNLAAIDQTRFLSQVLNRSEHACSWILKNDKFISWQESSTSRLLWITAKAGYGKTTVAAHICQMISTQPTPGTQCAQLYFFFQKSSHVKIAPAALRTIVRQLVDQIPAVLPILLRRHDLLSAKGDFEWSWENISGVLGEMLEELPLDTGVYIVLDALDEWEAESRMLILDWIQVLVEGNNPSTTFRSSLVTGRPDGGMMDQLSSFPTLDITETDTAVDIRALIHSRMERFASHRHLEPEVTRRIVQFLESNARGMFLWVVLIMKELEKRDERLSDEVIASKLSRTPLTLIDTYEAILHNAPQSRKQDMWRIFRWLLFGMRSLSLAELEIGLCLETGTSSWHDFEGDLKFLCGSLTRLGGPRKEVFFVHKTARDFLEAFPRNASTADVGGLDMDTHAAHEHLATVCVEYLLRDEIFWGWRPPRNRTHSVYVDMMQEFLGRHIFVRYAIESWAFHIRAVGTPSPTLSTMIRRLLSGQTRRDDIMILTFFINKQTTWNVPQGHSPLHLAAYFNIPWLAQKYTSDDKSLLHATTAMKDTPLIWASEMGSTECVKILLDAGADPNEVEIDGWSALHWAARNGHLGVARLLLDHGANLGQRARGGHTPLDWAIDREHWDVARVLGRRSDSDELGRLDRTSQLQQLRGQTGSMHVTPNTGKLWDYRP